MSTYTDASLIMFPSGYKASKIYSLKPTDGSGDLTFTRASTATRIGSDGLIEKVRTNLQTFSQTFSNAVWNKSAGATLTHSQTDPNGGTTASRLQMPSGTSNFLAASSITGLTNGGKYTHSVFMKSNTGSTQSVRILDGVRGVAGGTLTASVTTSWQRFDVVITTASTNAGMQIDNQGGTFANDILIAFAQTEDTDFGATPYIPTTTAAVSVGPVANIPRIDYTGGGCGKLLLEPQRTNTLQFSEQFDNAFWTLTSVSLTANSAASPDGSTNADLLYPSSSGNDKRVQRAISIVSGTTYTSSVFLKASGISWVRFYGAGFTSPVWFNVFDGVIGTISAGLTAKIENYGNGWYRCSVTETATVTGTGQFYINLVNGNGDGEVTANGTDGINFWGAQLEAGAYPTSYIPTLGASVTRSADSASKTGISSLIGQTQGTLFVEFNARPLSESRKVLVAFTDSNNFILLDMLNTNVLRFLVFAGGGQQASFTTPIGSQNVKMAGAYKSNDFVFYVNGVQIGTDVSGTVPATSQIYLGVNAIGAESIADGIAQTLLFKTRLTNAQLAEITA